MKITSVLLLFDPFGGTAVKSPHRLAAAQSFRPGQKSGHVFKPGQACGQAFRCGVVAGQIK